MPCMRPQKAILYQKRCVLLGDTRDEAANDTDHAVGKKLAVLAVIIIISVTIKEYGLQASLDYAGGSSSPALQQPQRAFG